MQRISLSRSGAAALLVAIIAGALVFCFAGVPNGGDMAIILIWFFCAFAAAGAFMLLRAPLEWLRKDAAAMWPPRMLPEVAPASYMPLTRHRHVPLIMGLPNFGMFGGWTLNLLMFVFMINGPWMQLGLRIRLPGPYPAARQNSPQSETLAVYLGKGGIFYVNGQIVLREQLRAKLQEELSRRVVWTVYFEADDNCQYAEAVYAMDTIQGVGAQVFWLTPRVREELKGGTTL